MSFVETRDLSACFFFCAVADWCWLPRSCAWVDRPKMSRLSFEEERLGEGPEVFRSWRCLVHHGALREAGLGFLGRAAHEEFPCKETQLAQGRLSLSEGWMYSGCQDKLIKPYLYIPVPSKSGGFGTLRISFKRLLIDTSWCRSWYIYNT